MSATSKGRNHLPHVHNFRGFAIVLIIVTHCISVFDWSATPELALFLKRFVANGTILFLFIAGYLFQHLSDRYRVGNYLWKKIRYVVLPYVVVSIPALVLFTVVMQRPGMPDGFYDKSVLEQMAFFLVTGSHLAPFWFIPTIIVFYLASPLLYWLDRQPWFYRLLPVLLIIPIFVSRGGHLNPLQSFVHFLPVWVLGMACSRYQDAATLWLKRLFWVLVAFAVIMFALEMQFAESSHSWYSSVSKIALTLVFFEMFRRWGEGGSTLFGLAASLSFGLFFLHSYLISAGKLALERFGGGLPTGSLWGYLFVSLLAVLASIGVVALARRILGSKSRLLIGV